MGTLDPYQLHKEALIPALKGELENGWTSPAKAGDTGFVRFLLKQQLQGLWLDLLEPMKEQAHVAQLYLQVKQTVFLKAGLSLPQQHVMALAHKELSNSNIPYFIAKGAHLKNVYYGSPNIRPSVDVDLFVLRNNMKIAIDILIEAGFDARPLTETLSHELKCSKHNADIDLHWHLFRPGRARPGLMDWLFEHREKFGDYWGLDATASLLVMLVHPAITKYLISPTSMLIHQVDQARLIESGKVDWKELERTLEWSGTKTAAWSSIYLLRKLGGVEVPDDFEKRIRQGRLHSGYLKFWIDRGWIAKWFEKRWVVAGFFSLALQDTIWDAVQALRLRSQSF